MRKDVVSNRAGTKFQNAAKVVHLSAAGNAQNRATAVVRAKSVQLKQREEELQKPAALDGKAALDKKAALERCAAQARIARTRSMPSPSAYVEIEVDIVPVVEKPSRPVYSPTSWKNMSRDEGEASTSHTKGKPVRPTSSPGRTKRKSTVEGVGMARPKATTPPKRKPSRGSNEEGIEPEPEQHAPE